MGKFISSKEKRKLDDFCTKYQIRYFISGFSKEKCLEEIKEALNKRGLYPEQQKPIIKLVQDIFKEV